MGTRTQQVGSLGPYVMHSGLLARATTHTLQDAHVDVHGAPLDLYILQEPRPSIDQPFNRLRLWRDRRVVGRVPFLLAASAKGKANDESHG